MLPRYHPGLDDEDRRPPRVSLSRRYAVPSWGCRPVTIFDLARPLPRSARVLRSEPRPVSQEKALSRGPLSLSAPSGPTSPSSHSFTQFFCRYPGAFPGLPAVFANVPPAKPPTGWHDDTIYPQPRQQDVIVQVIRHTGKPEKPARHRLGRTERFGSPTGLCGQVDPR